MSDPAHSQDELLAAVGRYIIRGMSACEKSGRHFSHAQLEARLVSQMLKPAVFLASIGPAINLAWAALTNQLGANPFSDIQNETGDWALRFLCATLAVSVLRRITGWNAIIRFRRMLGLFAFFYGILHFLAYVIFDKFAGLDFQVAMISWHTAWSLSLSVMVDIYRRPFIAVGFIAFGLMAPLAVTSTAAMIRRLGGRRWQALHRLIYALAILGVVHYWMKSGFHRVGWYAAILALLLGFRVYWVARPRLRNSNGEIRSMRLRISR